MRYPIAAVSLSTLVLLSGCNRAAQPDPAAAPAAAAERK